MDRDTERVIMILEKAADTLDTSGWCQGQYADHGSFCTMGALGVALTGNPSRARGNTPESERLYYQIITLLARRIELGTSIAAWNDTPGRTAEEVISHLRNTAKALESGEETLPDRPVRTVNMELEI